MAGFVHLDNATEQNLVGGVEKIFFAETLFSGDIDDVFGVGEHGTEEGAFGFVENGLNFVGAFMGSDDDLGASLLEFAE